MPSLEWLANFLYDLLGPALEWGTEYDPFGLPQTTELRQGAALVTGGVALMFVAFLLTMFKLAPRIVVYILTGLGLFIGLSGALRGFLGLDWIALNTAGGLLAIIAFIVAIFVIPRRRRN
jgi:hypothetical protein